MCIHRKDRIAILLIGVYNIHERALIHVAAIDNEGATGIWSIYVEGRLVSILMPELIGEGHLIAYSTHQHPFAEITIAGSFIGVCHMAIESVDIRCDDVICGAVLRFLPAHVLDGLTEDIALIEVGYFQAAGLADCEVDILEDCFFLILDCCFITVVMI